MRWRVDGQPDRNFEYYLYQTLVGAWPLTRERAHAHVEKAAREAKVFTDWLGPSEEYERALHHFVDDLFGDAGFIAEVAAFVDALHPADWIKGLSQQLLKLTIPGVPDLYQGSELWHRALVDPDNRRPVDYDVPGGAPRGVRPDDGRRASWRAWTKACPSCGRRAARCGSRRAIRRSPIRPRPTRRSKCVARRPPAPSASCAAATSRWWCRSAPGRREWTDTQVRLPDGRWHHVLADMTIDGGAVDLGGAVRRLPGRAPRTETHG